MGAEALGDKVPLHEPEGRRTDDDRVRGRQALQPGCKIWRLAQRQLLLASTAPHLTHHDHPRMDAETDGQAEPILGVETGIQDAEGLDYL